MRRRPGRPPLPRAGGAWERLGQAAGPAAGRAPGAGCVSRRARPAGCPVERPAASPPRGACAGARGLRAAATAPPPGRQHRRTVPRRPAAPRLAAPARCPARRRGRRSGAGRGESPRRASGRRGALSKFAAHRDGPVREPVSSAGTRADRAACGSGRPVCRGRPRAAAAGAPAGAGVLCCAAATVPCRPPALPGRCLLGCTALPRVAEGREQAAAPGSAGVLGRCPPLHAVHRAQPGDADLSPITRPVPCPSWSPAPAHHCALPSEEGLPSLQRSLLSLLTCSHPHLLPPPFFLLPQPGSVPVGAPVGTAETSQVSLVSPVPQVQIIFLLQKLCSVPLQCFPLSLVLPTPSLASRIVCT